MRKRLMPFWHFRHKQCQYDYGISLWCHNWRLAFKVITKWIHQTSSILIRPFNFLVFVLLWFIFFSWLCLCLDSNLLFRFLLFYDLVVTAIQGLIDAADEQLMKRDNNTTDLSKVRLNEFDFWTNFKQQCVRFCYFQISNSVDHLEPSDLNNFLCLFKILTFVQKKKK